MIYQKKIITKHLDLKVEITTLDGQSHAVVTKFHNEMETILSQGLDYMAGLIVAFEKEKSEELKRIGK